MPTITKVSPEIAATWSTRTPARPRDDRYTWAERPARIYPSGKGRSLALPPRVCDVLQLRAADSTPCEHTTGVVLDTRVRSDGLWTHVLLAIAGHERWVSKSTVATHLGRAKGLTRIDQPTKLIGGRVHGGTHAWFMRLYDGKQPRLAKTFSDQAAGGKLASLRAALALYTANTDDDLERSVVFL